MDRLRVATLQYFIRPIEDYAQFRDQVRGLVKTAQGYGSKLLVFPEYFTAQLFTLGDVEQPMREQVRGLADRAPEILGTMEELVRGTGLTVVAGSLPVRDEKDPDRLYNEAHVFSSDGAHHPQRKLHMTRFEKEVWDVSPGQRLKLFETEFCRLAVAICYDVEFPEIARAAAHHGAELLVVPSCTDDRQGFLRVRYCAHARAIENQMFVVHASTVGSLPMVPAVSLNWGQASVLSPSDYAFARDGILAEGVPNQETMVIADLDLRHLRSSRYRGTVLPLRDSKRTAEVLASLERIRLATPDAPQPGRKRRTSVRAMKREDLGELRALGEIVRPGETAWDEEAARARLEGFPAGQVVATEESSGTLVGACATTVVDAAGGEPPATLIEPERALDASRGLPPGAAVVVTNVTVRPGHRGRGIAKRLLARAALGPAERVEGGRVLAVAPLRGYHLLAGRRSPEDYLADVAEGRVDDPALSFLVAQGFRPRGLVAERFPGDPESGGWGAVLERSPE